MATIGQISQAAGYTGNAALGGEIDFGVTIDPSPIQRLATFTYYRDRDLWEKKKADDKLAADKIATIAAFDVTSPLKPYTEDLKKGLNELKQFVRDNPNALNYDKDPKLYQELVDRYGALQIKRKNATANDALYNAAKAKIELIPNKSDRDAQLEILDLRAKNLFSNGVDEAYNQQFESAPELKPEDYKIPTIPMTDAFTITRNANDTVIEGRAYADIDRVKALAAAAYFEMKPTLDKNSEAYKKLSPDEKRRAELEDSVTARKRITLDGIANNVNGLVQQFKAQPGNENITVAEIPEETLVKNSSIGGFIRLVKGYNKQIDEVNAATGKKYGYINLDDGATPEEIIELQSFSANGETLVKEIKPTVQQTDNAIQRENMRTQRALGWANLNWDKEKFQLGLKGPDETKSAAVVFAEGLVADIASIGSITGKDGSKILTPDDVRKLTADKLKWLGKELPAQRDDSGTVLQSAGVQPLVLAADEVLEIKKDGTIFVMKEAKFNDKSKRFSGKWDNGRSTTVGNIARLVLNEENQKSGSKEVNNYVPIDIGSRKPEIFVTESGGSTTVSGSSKTGGKFKIVNPQTGKVVMEVTSQEEANKAAAKGYTIQ